MSSLRARGEGLVWLIGAVVYLWCCTAGPIVRYRCRAMDGRIMRRGIISSCQSVEFSSTSEVVKHCWS